MSKSDYTAKNITVLKDWDTLKFPFQVAAYLHTKYPHRHPDWITKNVQTSFLVGDSKCKYFEDKYLLMLDIPEWEEYTEVFKEQ